MPTKIRFVFVAFQSAVCSVCLWPLDMRAQSSGDALAVPLRNEVSPQVSRIAVLQLLRSGGVPGGVIARTGCADNSRGGVGISAGTTLKDALNQIAASDSATTWSEKNGVVNLTPAHGQVAVMQTIVPKFSWDSGMTMPLIVRKLMSDPAVHRPMAALGIGEELETGPGLQAAPKVVQQPTAAAAPQQFTSEGKSLLDTLNEIARTRHGQWSYLERSCGGRTTYSIEGYSR